MFLSESLVWTLGYAGCDFSGVKVLCEDSVRDDVAERFLADFSLRWQEALEDIKKEYGNVEDRDGDEEQVAPISIRKTDDGFFISVPQLDIGFDSGAYYDLWHGCNAFESALGNLFPQKYKGYIGFGVSDQHCGEVFQWELPDSGCTDVYDFVGKALNELFTDKLIEQPSIWEDFAEELKSNRDFGDTIRVLYAYSEWLPKDTLDSTVKSIIDVAEEYDDGMKDELFALADKLKLGE